MTREEAWSLVCEFTESERLRGHALAVEAGMREYARIFGEDEALWGVVGLVHDFDYERWPTPPDHTREGARILRERGVDEEIIGAVMSHADWNVEEYPRDRPLRKALFAVDELCQFIVAVAYVRPDKLAGLEPKSVKKKLKQASFAAGVSRDDVHAGAELLGLPLDDHIRNCIAGLRKSADKLGLA